MYLIVFLSYLIKGDENNRKEEIAIEETDDSKKQTYCQDAQTGETIADGKVWFDGCRQCMCQRGVQYCSLVACKKLPSTCAASVKSQIPKIDDENTCCPTCISTSNG